MAKRPHLRGAHDISVNDADPSDRTENSTARPLLSEGEKSHFSFGTNDKDTMLAKLGPVVKSYAKEGYRKPRDVSRLLNDARIWTARGEKWTPRLTWFLLAMLFEDKSKRGKGVWDQTASAALARTRRVEIKPGSKRKNNKQRLPPPSGVGSLSALPNPLARERLPRRRHVQAKALKFPLPAASKAPSPGAALTVIPKLRSMLINDMISVWRNAITALKNAKPGYPPHEVRKLLDAISKEWEHRRLGAHGPEDYFKWPSTDAKGGTGGLMAADWQPEGLLKYMEYTVGRTEGLSQQVREGILSEVFSGHLPPLISPGYMEEWGLPGTAKRLRKMAESIASFTRNAKRRRDDRMHDAVKDWEHDLNFLYHQYYVGHFGFGWPSTSL